MSIIPPGEKIVETKKCRIGGEKFFITDKDLEFYDKVSPVFGGKKYLIPTPTLCPDERARRRYAYRNNRHVYLRKSSFSGENIFSMHSQDKAYPVYENEVYYSDRWNSGDYTSDFTEEKGFFEQLYNLSLRVPRSAKSVLNLENSDYCNNASNVKDSYLSFNGGESEKLFYTETFIRSVMCFDCLSIDGCRESYECIDCTQCESCYFCHDLSQCRNCYICDSCIECHDCISCANLSHKSYCIGNQQFTREGYLSQLEKINISTILNKSRQWISTQPKRFFQGIKTENVTGNQLINVRNIHNSFECSDCENMRFCNSVKTGKNCMDISNFGWNPEWCYECGIVGHNSQNILFSNDVWRDCSNVIYSQNCSSIHDCFACCGLHSHEHHCILNKPYSVSEYETLCGRIIDHMRSTGEWGEFFPHELSPFGYNETVAQEYFPLTEEEVKAKGWNWHTEEKKIFEGNSYKPLTLSQYDERVVGYENAVKNINECLAGTLVCEVTRKPFKIIKQELVFYIENGIPLPTKHPDQRHKERMDLRNPRKLYERTCNKCEKDIITTYTPDRPERVLCEECYRKLIF